MCPATPPLTTAAKLALIESWLAETAAEDAAGLPTAVLAERLAAQERIDAAGAALRGTCLHAFDAQDGSVADGQKTTRAWLVNCLRVTKWVTPEVRRGSSGCLG